MLPEQHQGYNPWQTRNTHHLHRPLWIQDLRPNICHHPDLPCAPDINPVIVHLRCQVTQDCLFISEKVTARVNVLLTRTWFQYVHVHNGLHT